MTGETVASAAPGAARQPRVEFHKRLYVWSVLLEPLFFFVLFEESVSGVTGNLSRILQFAVCLLLAGRVVMRGLRGRKVPLPNPWHPYFRNYTNMLLLAAVAGVIGYFAGAYDLPAYTSTVDRSAFSKILNSAAVRPLFEYVAAAYYFVYFVVLPKYILVNADDVDYAVSRFKVVFTLSFIIGVIDLGFSLSGIYVVPRHLADWRFVEARFHGLAGEPRQAFVYLLLGLAIFHLDAFRKGHRLSRTWGVLIVAAAAMTQSTTGLVGGAIFIGLYLVYSLWGATLRRLLRVAVAILLLTGLGYVTVINSPRMGEYFDSATGLWTILETGQDLPFLMTKSNSDIYPMYDLTVKARHGEILPVLIGSGLGSASVVSNRYYKDWSNLNNPHSQLARSLFETGLLGTYLYIFTFVGPVRRLTAGLSRRRVREFITLTLLLIACSLADRSSAPFLYLGFMLAGFRVWDTRDLKEA